jgi:ABC-2 type transport system permease protein
MKFAQVETRLFVRDPIALFFGLVLPGLLLLLLGLFFPGFD